VFYASQSYTRYDKQYDCAMSCQGRLNDICLLATNCFQQSEIGRAAAHRMMRHANAVHVLGYVGLGSSYNEENFLRGCQSPRNSAMHAHVVSGAIWGALASAGYARRFLRPSFPANI
jgi:hypothetical protein